MRRQGGGTKAPERINYGKVVISRSCSGAVLIQGKVYCRYIYIYTNILMCYVENSQANHLKMSVLYVKVWSRKKACESGVQACVRCFLMQYTLVFGN